MSMTQRDEVEMMRLGILVVLAAVVAGCSSGSGPQIMPLDDVRARCNDTVIIDLRVLEATGDETWSFTAPDIPDIQRHASITRSGASAMFRWIPLASHSGMHPFTFTVTNSQGSDSETIQIEVLACGGVPRFIQPPPGGTFDLSENPCVDVDIEVIDEDAINVTIREGEPRIQGGQMTQTEGFRARWHWCPTPEQINATLRYTLHLEADDGQNPPVRQPFDIVLLDDGPKPDCEGLAPQIASAAAAQNPYNTERDYEVNATITDDRGLKDMPVLHYSTEAPDPASPDVTRMSTVTFGHVEGAQYRAFIPNLRLREGETRTIYFIVSATDNDDPEGTRCDHTTRSPVYQFVAGHGVDYSEYCDACSNDGQCLNGLCVVSLAGGGTTASQSFCGRDCGSGCAEGTCQNITSRGGLTEMQCVPDALRCDGGGGGDCTDDSYEDANDSPATAPMLTVGSTGNGQICPDDLDYFAVDLVADTEYRIYATGWTLPTDIDITLATPTNVVIGLGAGTTDAEDFTVCPATSGRHSLEISGYDGAQGPYMVQVTTTGGSCCDDDDYEDNDVRADAAPMVCGFGIEEALYCPGDEDWFSFTAPSAMTVDIDMACDAGSSDLDLQLFDSVGTRLGSSLGMTCDESLTASLPTGGTYYVRVFSYSSSATGSYLLDCAESSSASCTDTRSCPAGTVCDPSRGCIDETCTPGVTTCPSGHICPPAGLAGESSVCMPSCTSSSTCRTGYECKIFETGRACAPTGSGQTGQPCRTFEDCAQERICLNASPSGYCAEINCMTSMDCPMDSHTSTTSRCVSVGSGRNICLMDCLVDDALCNINPGTCTATRDVSGSAAWVCVLPGQSVPAY